MEKKMLSENVKQWFMLDEKISGLSKHLRELRNKKKELSKGLLGKMEEYDIKTFETKSGNLVYTERTVKMPVTKKHIIKVFFNYSFNYLIIIKFIFSSYEIFNS